MPWLHGFATATSSDTIDRDVSARMEAWQACEEPCADNGGIEIRADVVAGDGPETVLATFRGLVVLDDNGRLVARSRGFEPTGSSDELLALAVGDAMLDTPVIAVSARAGGRRESQVWLELYRVGPRATLDRVFSAVTELHDEQAAIGSVTLLAGGLLDYKAPGETVTRRYTFDAGARRYLTRGPATP
jgi:hypothetical protein